MTGHLNLNTKAKGFFTRIDHEYQNFDDFVRNFTPSRLNVRKRDYFALDHKAQKQLKITRWFSGCYFDGQLRRKSDIIEITLLVVDVDHQGHLFDAEFVHNRFKENNYIWYETASSTDEVPRYRFILECTGVSVETYVQSVKWVMRELGLDDVTDETLCAHQLYYFPVVFKGGKNPRMRMNHGKKPIEIDFSETDDDQIERIREDISLEVGTDLTEEQIQAVLSAIPPDCSYNEWIEVCFGLKHEFNTLGRNDDERGYELFDTWSRGGDKYDGPDGTASKWKSAKITGGKTFKSVIKLAQKYGYRNTIVWEDKINACTSYEQLTDVVIEYATKEDGLRDVLIIEEIRRLGRNEAWAAPMTKTVFERLVKAARKQQEEKEFLETCREIFGKMLIYYSAAEEKYIVISDHGETIMKPSGFVTWCTYEYHREAKRVFETRLWQHFMLEREPYNCRRMVYQPSQSIKYTSDRCYNTHSRRDVFPDHAILHESDTERTARGFLDQLLELSFGQDERKKQVVKQWLAFIVQNPGIRLGWIPILTGRGGAGKSIYGEILAETIGAENVCFVNGVKVISRFNSFVSRREIVVADEFVCHSESAMDYWKMLITANEAGLERKGEELENYHVVCNFLGTSNDPDPVSIADDDRRFLIMPTRSDFDNRDPNRRKKFARIRDHLKAFPYAWKEMLNSLDHSLIEISKTPNVGGRNVEKFEDLSESEVDYSGLL